MWLSSLLFGFMAIVSGAKFNITPINQHPGIYFEEIGKVELYSSEWKVVVFFDLKTLTDALTRTRKYVTEINHLCGLMHDNPGFSQICSSTVLELNRLMADIMLKYNLLETNNRSKRSLFGAIGIVSKSLFGTLNEEDAKYYNIQIDKLQRNENHLLNLLKNQTIILETTTNIFSKSQTDISKQMAALNSKMTKLTIMTEELANMSHDQRVFSEMESLTTLTTIIIIRYQSVVNNIVDLVTDVRHGKPHPFIITPFQLGNLLNTIRREITTDIRLPSDLKDDNLLQLYRISSMSTTILNDRILYELRIPLPYKESYQVYKVIPLPTKFQQNFIFIQPSIDYLLIDYDRQHYYDLNSAEFVNCVTEDHNQYLCRMVHPLLNANSINQQCEIQLIKRTNGLPHSCNIRISNHSIVWTQLSQANRWLFSTQESIIVEAVCQDEITPYTLSRVGIIEIPGNCYLRTSDLMIRAYNSKQTQIKSSYVPPLNISELMLNHPKFSFNLTDKVAVIKYTHGGKDLTKISDKIKALKNEEEKGLPSLNQHDVHHYTLTYILLAIILIIIVYGAHKAKLCSGKLKRGKIPIHTKESAEANSPPFVFTCASST